VNRNPSCRWWRWFLLRDGETIPVVHRLDEWIGEGEPTQPPALDSELEDDGDKEAEPSV
jgi:hypothetical protein